MAGVVEAQTTHAAHGARRQRAEQAFDGEFAVGDAVRAKDVACNLAGRACLADVGRAGGQDGVAVADLAIARDESYQSCEGHGFLWSCPCVMLLPCGCGAAGIYCWTSELR